ncbi:uncharacterized protein LOC114535596 [Dendronephthya gigantea]|uniref:uncharacterized protein LOC114535596 n=1 Tax=Dendronephthya gigantea TaxID=151771 RepID=UPI00106ACE2F|nr:uncharacterized protein LOC114535596 [Dendronephthya gigantea]
MSLSKVTQLLFCLAFNLGTTTSTNNTDSCGRSQLYPPGNLTSPRFPFLYPNNMDCNWTVSSTSGRNILLQFSFFLLESHSSCYFDYLDVYDGESATATKLGRFCGNQLPRSLVSSGLKLFIVFHSDFLVSAPGFVLNYSTPLDVNECYLGTHNCSIGASCVNTDESFYCICKSGYTGNGVTCTDINECELEIDNCHSQASCRNTNGTFDCSCNFGFSGDGIACREVETCNKTIDLGFLLDSSWRTTGSNFTKMKSFVKDLTDRFNVTQNGTRVSVISYASQITFDIPFSRVFETRRDLHSAIDSVSYAGGFSTYTAFALQVAYYHMFHAANGARISGAKQILIVLTASQSVGNVYQPSQQLKNIGVIIFSVGVGSEVHVSELETMASAPAEDHVFLLGNFSQLSNLTQKMASSTCNATYRPPFTTPTPDICGESHLYPPGSLQNPSFVPQYPYNMHCNWTVTSTNGRNIQLQSSFFRLPYSSGCLLDYLDVYDGDSESAPRLGMFCGLQLYPIKLQSTGLKLFIRVRVDNFQRIHGFAFNYSTLFDVNECELGIHNCSIGKSCINTNGSFYCGQCIIGYTGMGEECTDINECELYTDNCDSHASCINTNGSFNCFCNFGYVGDGVTCREVETCNKTIDLGFLLDSSWHTRGIFYTKMKSFVKDLTDRFNVSQNGTRVSVMSYASSITFDIRFSRVFQTRRDLHSAIDSVSFAGGFITRTDLALRIAYVHMFHAANGARISGAKQILIVLTAGQSVGSVYQPSQQLKNIGVIIFSVGVCSGVDVSELETMASAPAEDHVFLLGNFSELSNLTQKMASSTCNATYRPPFTTSAPDPCGRRQLYPPGTLTSPLYPLSYPNNMDCSWTISSTNGRNILLQFSFFSLESASSCVYDYLDVYDGDSATATRLGRFCGNQLPRSLVSSGPKLFMVFHTDFSVTKQGFALNYTTTFDLCGESHLYPPGSLQNPPYLLQYPYNMHCSWTITSTNGRNIQLKSLFFMLPYSSGCLLDYLDVYDGDSASAPRLGRFCGLQLFPINLQSTGLKLFISFRLDNFQTIHGFTFNYSTLFDVNECELGIHNCSIGKSCINTNGSFYCGQCIIGYTGVGEECIDINECELDTDNCDSHASCINTKGSFNCLCNSGYLGDGVTCQNITTCPKRIDLGFMLDSSGSIGSSNFNKTKSFIKDITDYFNITPNNTRVAVMSYATLSTVHFPFSRTFVSRQDLHLTIDSIPYSKGGTNTAQALIKAYEEMFNGSQVSGVKKVLIVFTDGQSSGNVSQPAQQLKNIGVIIFSIGIGSGIDVLELKTMASPPVDDHVFLLHNFNEFSSLVQNLLFSVCNDINECQTNPCDINANCTHVDGSYECTCHEGYEGNGINCTDVNECEDNPCHVNANCTTINGWYECNCHEGYEGNGTSCTDMDECKTNPCDVNANCTNVDGSYECTCHEGHAGNGKNCTDVNECEDNPCDVNANCTTVNGWYECNCHEGYEGNGTSCTDIDECETNPCDVNANCTNVDGSYECTCHEGHAGNGKNCTDVNECEDNPCDVNANCTTVNGWYECNCHEGYEGNGTSCTDINECETNPCDVNANCTNVDGSYECTCHKGYEGNGKNCTDVNECEDNPCDVNANCTTINGWYECNCHEGYEGNGTNCTDIDECETNPCDANANCKNVDGSYECTCHEGYEGNGKNCTDVNECEENPCDVNANCTNNNGWYECNCHEGYEDNGTSCTDINECEKYPCDENANCTNVDGSYECTCHEGYEGNGKNCTDINECKTNPCDENANCTNVDGSYKCICHKGHEGNGMNCTDVNECEDNPCDVNANCTTINGWYECNCHEGYEGNGTSCTGT